MELNIHQAIATGLSLLTHATLDQVMIPLTGLVAAWVVQDTRGHVRRWACIIGLLGQPFWFYSTWTASQWGTFILVVGYTVSFLRGLWNFRRLAKTESPDAITSGAL